MAKLPKPKFNLRKASSKTETLISLVFRFKGQRLVYSTGFSINPKDWDFNVQRPLQQKNRHDLLIIKRSLDNLSTTCLDIFINNEYGNISISDFKDQLDLKLGRTIIKNTIEDNSSRPSLIEFLFLELEDMKVNQGIKPNTIRSFRLHANNLKKFTKEVRSFDYEDVDWNFRLEMIDWLSAKNVKLGYGNKTLSVLRQFLERARKKKYHSNTDYLGTGWMIPQKKAKGQIIILSPQELKALASLNLTGIKEKVRDLFLIGAGTGQRFSDYSKYNPDNFFKTINNIPVISIISQKTATPTTVPLNIFPWLIPILEKHKYESPKVSMQKLNLHIKEICKVAGFDNKMMIVEQKFGRKVSIQKKYYPKFELISSHTCRRSFATNLYRMGYRLAQIMPLTGHATESQLREYIGIDNEMNAEEIAFSIMKRNKENKRSDNTGNLKIVNY